MKTRKFYDLEQASSYLAGSVIRVANHPVNIVAVESGNRGKGNFKLTYTKVDDPYKKTMAILSDSDEVDMNPLPMGMLAIKPGSPIGTLTAYALRIPARAYKVGTTRTNTTFMPIVHNSNYYDGSLIYTKEFVDSVKGNYLTLPEALKATEKKGIFPFSRRFAVAKDRSVYYKTFLEPVGKVDGGEVVLNDEAFFLKEVLREDLNGR